jgi:putative flippase GtrA
MVLGKETVQTLLRSEKVRFGLVGGVNTATDFSVLFILVKALGVPVFAANIVSTSVAIGVSYLLNKKAVFGNDGQASKRQVALFIIVTLMGLWVIQTIIIALVSQLFYMSLHMDAHNILVLFVSKALATAVTLVWNYLWYSRVVFKKEQS